MQHKIRKSSISNISLAVRGEVENPLLETGLDLENEITIMKQLLNPKTIYFLSDLPKILFL